MRIENKEMKSFLKQNGVDANPKFIAKGSLKGTWRLTGMNGDAWRGYQKWTSELMNKLTNLGFVDFDSSPLNEHSGNGGMFSVFVKRTI